MEYRLLRSVEQMDEIAHDWNRLLENSSTHVPFLRHEYLKTWWENRGGGEWNDAELAIVTAQEDGQLVGLAPLFQAVNRENQPALLLLGSIEISDYLDVLAQPALLQPFLDGLLDFLPGTGLAGAVNLDWYNLLDDSPTLSGLESAAGRTGWTYETERLQHSPFIKLPGDWETYLAGIDKKQRHEIRRKLRRFEENVPDGRWYVVDSTHDLEAEAEDFMSLMQQDEEKARFLTPAMRVQMHAIMRCAFDAGCLQLSFLEIGGQKAAGYLSFDYLNRIWVYNSGLDTRFSEYSPGWVLLAHLLQWANENGKSEFDFMRGDEDYKYRFGATDRTIVRVRLTKPTE